MATKKEVAQQQQIDDSYFDGMEGEGLDQFTGSAISVSYLSMVQAGSKYESKDSPAGTWVNSATGRCYGDSVKVIPLAFRTIWSERMADPPFTTVGRYPVGSIAVTTKEPPAGKRGYPKMINPATGNEVQELFVYAVFLPEYPEDGVLFLNPTVASMRGCRSWNSQIKGQILPSGAQAPIFGFSWDLMLGIVDTAGGKKTVALVKAARDTIVSREMFEVVKPLLAPVKQDVLQITQNAELGNEE